jgi:hypothetical protein
MAPPMQLLGSTILWRDESNRTFDRFGLKHQLSNCLKYFLELELGVVSKCGVLIGDKEALFLQICQSPSEVCIGFGQPSYIHECTHNLDIHCERAWAVENRGKHCDALFGKCKWRRPPSSMSSA